MRPERGWGWAVGAAGLALVGCASDPTPVLREDLARVRTDLARIEQSLQRGQAEVKAELQQSDRRSAQTLGELQRSVAQLGSRLDELGRETGRIQGRLDELRLRVDALALQFDVAGPTPGGGARPAVPSRPAEPTRPGAPSGSAGPAAPPAGMPSLARQATDLYQTAYIDYTRGNYNLAIAAFKEFIRLYPNTDLAEKAQYWIGESHFSLARDVLARGEREKATREFERAVQEFRRVLINYPRGDRVPSALYKEALALLELRQPELAAARLQFLVDQFPSTEEAAKAKEELVRLRSR